jgi:hypothetical protein
MKKQNLEPLKIGETGTAPDGQKVECCKSEDVKESCNNCYLSYLKQCQIDVKFRCMISTRPDLQDVYFKKVE